MIRGIHHITAISGAAQENLDFYAGTLGMRLVKRSVNQDDPGTYHLFFADGAGTPGTDLTFFPWPGMPSGRLGVGLTVEVPLAVPDGSLEFWAERLREHGMEVEGPTVQFGEQALRFGDPHGLRLALVETERRDFVPWEHSTVPPEVQIRGLHAARILERNIDQTAAFLTEVLGFEPLTIEDGWRRYAVDGGGSGKFVDLCEVPDGRRGAWGVGTVHHVAWRVADVEAEREVRRRVAEAGRRPTDIIDRFWFRSVYFMEPGGALFELATDGPGFAVDEDPDSLGEHLVLPPWLEPQRARIEAGLPPLSLPHRK